MSAQAPPAGISTGKVASFDPSDTATAAGLLVVGALVTLVALRFGFRPRLPIG